MASGDKPVLAENSPASVLFVCAMNAIRSPMAEFLVKDLFRQKIFAQSAGVHAGEPDGFMISVMKERGINMSTHEPRTLEEIGESYFDLIVTLSPEAHHRSLEFIRSQAIDVEYWPTADPSTVAGRREQVLQAYRDVRDSLENRIRQRFEE